MRKLLPVSFVCVVCGRSKTIDGKRAPGRTLRYCSLACANISRRVHDPVTVECCVCGVPFVYGTHRNYIKNKTRNFYCIKCANETQCGRATHRLTNSREYRVWTNIKTRCLNPRNEAYARYGGRGITICDEWIDSFSRFYADMGPCPNGMTLDRIDNSKGYNKANCQWRSYKQQNNNRRDNIWLEHNGKRQTLSQWADDMRVNRSLLYGRYRLGWNDARILQTSTPAGT